jgi:hypothetical protein
MPDNFTERAQRRRYLQLEFSCAMALGWHLCVGLTVTLKGAADVREFVVHYGPTRLVQPASWRYFHTAFQ